MTDKPEPSKAVSEILDLINQECIYWHGRDESRRGGYAILLQKAKDISDKEVSRSEELSRLFVDATEQACKAMTERDELLGLLRDIGHGCSRRDMPCEATIAEWSDRIDATLERQKC